MNRIVLPSSVGTLTQLGSPNVHTKVWSFVIGLVLPVCDLSGRTPKAMAASAARIDFLISFSFLNLGLLLKEPHRVTKYIIPQDSTSAKLDFYRENHSKGEGQPPCLESVFGCSCKKTESYNNISSSHYPTSEFTFNGRPDA